MKDEIKEIYLSNLELTKTHDNMGGVMCNLIFKDNMSYEEYEKLLKSGYFVLCNKDCITNLQEKLKETADLCSKHFVKIQTLKDYKSRNEKAIECINHYAVENEDYSKIYNDEEKELLNILNGDDNE